MCNLLYYNIDPHVEAFSTEKSAALPYHVIQPHQKHSDGIAIINSPLITREELEGIDALITNLRGVAIGVRSADCVPILLYDPVQNVIAAIHSGWRGTVLRISQKVIKTMVAEFHTEVSDISAVICPSIGHDAFQIGPEVVAAFKNAFFPMSQIYSMRGEKIDGDLTSGHHIDLWEANRWLLNQAGIPISQIYVSGICTYQNHHRFYSARYEHDNKCQRIINSIKML